MIFDLHRLESLSVLELRPCGPLKQLTWRNSVRFMQKSRIKLWRLLLWDSSGSSSLVRWHNLEKTHRHMILIVNSMAIGRALGKFDFQLGAVVGRSRIWRWSFCQFFGLGTRPLRRQLLRGWDDRQCKLGATARLGDLRDLGHLFDMYRGGCSDHRLVHGSAVAIWWTSKGIHHCAGNFGHRASFRYLQAAEKGKKTNHLVTENFLINNLFCSAKSTTSDPADSFHRNGTSLHWRWLHSGNLSFIISRICTMTTFS